MRKSIVNRLRLFLLIPLISIFVLSAVLWTFNIRELNSYNREMAELLEKRNELRLIQYAFEAEISEIRGFIAIGNDTFLTRMNTQKEKALKSMQAYSALPLTSDERSFIDGIKRDIITYNEKYMPAGIQLGKARDYQGINKLANNQGATKFVNNIRERLENQMERYTQQLSDEQSEHQNYITYSLGGFLTLLLLILVLSFWITTRFGREIGKPLQTLTASAQRLSDGEYEPVTTLEREDEIGELARAFNQMIKDIEEKEVDLLSHNQELTAHQEELYAQQLELEETVEKLTDKENLLLRRNQLSTSLATDIEVGSMLSKTLDSMLLLMRSQLGAIIVLDEEIERRTVSRGISAPQLDVLLTHLHSGMSGRAINEKTVHTLQRPPQAEEQDYHEAYPMHDLYVPLLDREDNVIALLLLTRLSGLAFSPSEISEVQALGRQISLAIENAVSYNKTQRAHSISQAILNSALEGIALIDTHKKMLAVNHAWCEMYGLDKPEDIALMPNDVFDTLIRPRLKYPDEVSSFYTHAITGALSETEELTFEMVLPSYRVMKMYHRRVTNEHKETLGWIIVTRDITREYEVDRMKSEFVSTVSHELRTPLSSILGFVEIMLQRKITPDKQMRYLNTIYKEARRLTNLINDFLDVQRMESGKQEYNKQPLRLHEVTEEVIQLQQTSSHQIVFNQNTERDVLMADHEKMQQVITNLLSNAIKYAPAGGTITVTVDSCASRPQDVCLHIQDEGLGIPEEAIPHLFEKFYRVDNSDRRKIGGTGLGLAICAEIVKAHNGLIHVQSELGKGSIFTVSLPTYMGETPLPDPKSHTLSEPQAAVTQEAEQMFYGHILIVEDDESLRAYLSEELGNSLQRRGIKIVHVSNGEKALQSIEQEPPLLIILDIMLGEGKDGWEIIQELKRSEHLRSIPVVISSALEEKEKGYGYGISDYLIKPYPAEKLTTTVWNVLQQTNNEGHVFIPKEKGSRSE
ncbi:ATP-binding protein [Aneurinibacillus sp. REN35]|uniref:ATP-binding protein n=1 Tax=Aneurinibacillus sp. REN35 TaxID=3237286 RepID=UPI0035275FE0